MKRKTVVRVPRIAQAGRPSYAPNQAPQRTPQARPQARPQNGAMTMHQNEAEAAVGDVVIMPDQSVQAVGGIASVPGWTPVTGWLNFTLENTTGSTVEYRIGSELGATLYETARVPADRGSIGGPGGVTAMNTAFAFRAKLIKEIHMNVSGAAGSAAQFNALFDYLPGRDAGGDTRGNKRVAFPLAQRPTNQNDLLLILRAQGDGWRLGVLEQFFIDVLANTTVDLALALAAVENR